MPDQVASWTTLVPRVPQADAPLWEKTWVCLWVLGSLFMFPPPCFRNACKEGGPGPTTGCPRSPILLWDAKLQWSFTPLSASRHPAHRHLATETQGASAPLAGPSVRPEGEGAKDTETACYFLLQCGTHVINARLYPWWNLYDLTGASSIHQPDSSDKTCETSRMALRSWTPWPKKSALVRQNDFVQVTKADKQHLLSFMLCQRRIINPLIITSCAKCFESRAIFRHLFCDKGKWCFLGEWLLALLFPEPVTWEVLLRELPESLPPFFLFYFSNRSIVLGAAVLYSTQQGCYFYFYNAKYLVTY